MAAGARVWAVLVGLLALTGCTPISMRVAEDPLPNAPLRPIQPWTGAGPVYPPGGVAETRRAAAEFPGVVADPDPDVTYDLPGLIDLALRVNPETRRSWEQARAAAARLGVSGAAYLPTLTLLAAAGYLQSETRSGTGPLFTTGPLVTPRVQLSWLLIDFGRRDADFDRTLQQLLGANLQFNRAHQQVAYDVQRTVYAYDAAQAQVDAAVATLTAAMAVEGEADARLAHGLATIVDLLDAERGLARARTTLVASRAEVLTTAATLAFAAGDMPAQ